MIGLFAAPREEAGVGWEGEAGGGRLTSAWRPWSRRSGLRRSPDGHGCQPARTRARCGAGRQRTHPRRSPAADREKGGTQLRFKQPLAAPTNSGARNEGEAVRARRVQPSRRAALSSKRSRGFSKHRPPPTPATPVAHT